MSIFGRIKSAVSRIFGSAKIKPLPRLKSRRTPPPEYGDEPTAINEDYLPRFEGGAPVARKAEMVDTAEWYPLISSNVDRIRYGRDDHVLQVIFKKGACYEYGNVEGEIFLAFLRAPSPGQFVHYVLIQYGYPYKKISSDGSHETAAPAADRFSEQPYAVPEDIQAIQAAAGRKPVEGRVNTSRAGLWNKGTPKSTGVVKPPIPFK